MKEKKLGFRYAFFIGLAVSCLVILFFSYKPLFVNWVDNKIYDTYLRNSPREAVSDKIIIVDIDEKSLKTLGQWPWSRYLVAFLLESLTNAGAEAIGVDILLSEPDRSSPELIKSNLKKFFDIDVAFKNLPEELYNNDELLAEILPQTPTVLGMQMLFKDNESVNGLTKPINTAFLSLEEAMPAETFLLKPIGMTAPLKIFYENTATGYITVEPSSDGIIRKVPLIMAMENEEQSDFYINLSLRTLMESYGAKTLIVAVDQDGLSSIKIGKTNIPLEPDGNFYVKFKSHGGAYKYISASDIILDKFDAKDIENKIVFIGSSAAGLLDIRSTPLDGVYPGVEVHASVVDSIISGNFISVPYWISGAQKLLIVFFALLIAILLNKISAYFSLPITIILVAAFWVSGQYLFNNGLFLSPLYLILTVGLECLIILTAQFIFESSQKKKIKNAFSRYVSPIVVSQIANSGIDVFKGSERVVSAMFTDIRSFTTISEKLRPEQVVEMLNRYFTPMTALIKNSDGTLDKFIGDAIVAFWNAPLDVENHAKKAIQTGIDMQDELAKLNIELEKDYGIKLSMGAGVNTGRVYVGNMGSQELLDYTMIGDNVNLTSRLEGLCSKYGVTLVVSENSKKMCENDFYFQVIDKIKVKGKTEAISTYYPLKMEDAKEREEELEIYAKAYSLYVDGEFSEAEKLFGDLLSQFEKSVTKKLYEIYFERCQQLKDNKPSDWNGVWEYSSK